MVVEVVVVVVDSVAVMVVSSLRVSVKIFCVCTVPVLLIDGSATETTSAISVVCLNSFVADIRLTSTSIVSVALGELNITLFVMSLALVLSVLSAPAIKPCSLCEMGLSFLLFGFCFERKCKGGVDNVGMGYIYQYYSNFRQSRVGEME